MGDITVSEETIDRLERLQQEKEEENYDEIINELINIYHAEELTLSHGGDEL